MRLLTRLFCIVFILFTSCASDEEQEELAAGAERTLVRKLGNDQVALPYQRLPDPIRVLVIDRFSSSVSGVEVEFSVEEGGGSVTEEVVVTNESGTAQTRWILGGEGPQVLEVSVRTATGAQVEGSPMAFTATFPIVDCPDAIDADGYQYPTVIIANRCWTAENLRTATFQNGDSVPIVTDNTLWSGTEDPAAAYFDNNPEIHPLYGKLYNWYAVADERNLCPVGWHVATTEDYDALVTDLGGTLEAGGKMKFLGTDLWNLPNTAAD
ncbi:MAG: fibrobacter succinogenes major paralogous domain-containing protein, partial [Flavobacteriales bacterium]|nr:fibrobacter succinogenes major paralogous domain-containing protein [Flavobacteriales bacterium]